MPDLAARSITRAQAVSLPPTFMTLGDSITAHGGNNVNSSGVPSLSYVPVQNPPAGATNCSWQLYSMLLSNSRVRDLGSAATSGMTTKQAHDTWLPVVLKVKPTYCVVCLGQNDSDVMPSGNWNTEGKLYYARILDKLLAEGIIPIVASIPATGISLNRQSTVQYFAQQRGLPVVDFYAATVDETTGVYVSGYAAADGVHPIELGAYHMGAALADVWRQLHPDNPSERWLGTTNNYSTSSVAIGLLQNRPLLLSEAGTGVDVIPQSWVNGASGDGSFVASDPSNPWRGRKYTRARRSSGDTTLKSADKANGVVAGDVLMFAVRLAADVEGVGGSIRWRIVDSGGSTVLWDSGLISLDFGSDMAAEGLLAARFTVPSGYAGTAAHMEISAVTVTGAAYDMAQPTFRNLTQQGAVF